MSDSRTCPECGADIFAGAPAGLCPVCLLKAGFASHPDVDQQFPPTHITPPTTSRFEPPAPEELTRLFPQLEILELLGKGGMGAVYKARHPGLDRMVAVKILPPEISRDPAFAERFQREARALARLSHPHIVAVYDFGQTEGLCWFVMEFVDGANLRQMLRSGTLAPPAALAIVPQVCEALQFAHDEGIVHRDIKPENILLDRKGRVKIADFGLAKLLGETELDHSLTATHQVMGTLRYMAPEQMQGSREVDHRADIYSLGVVFYELLTGDLPMGRFAPPSRKVQIDVRLDEVVLRALEQDPEQRYQHADDVKTDMETISRSPQPTSAASPISTAGMANPAKPQQWFVAASVSDPILFRRLTVINFVVGLLWVMLLGGLQWGYLVGAEWYFKQELPYGMLTTWWLVSTVWLAISLASWSYVLAKRPDEPRSLADFWRIVQTPDARVRRMWKPALAYGVVWVVTVVVSWNYGDAAQTLSLTAGFALAPWVCMGIVRHTFAERHAQLVVASRPQSIISQPRFSGFAIAGAVWALFGVLAIVPTLFFIAINRVWNGTALPTDFVHAQPPLAFTIFMGALLAIGSGAPIGTTIYGAIAIGRIKRSGGKLIGLPLAVADVQFFPLLALGGLIAFLTAQLWMGLAPHPNAAALYSAASFGTLVALVVCFFIARAVWRAVRPDNDAAVRERSAESWNAFEISATASVAIAFMIATVKGICELAQCPSPLDLIALQIMALSATATGALLVFHQFRRPVGSRAALPDLFIALLAACAGSLPWTAVFSPIAGWNFWQGAVFTSLNFVLSIFLLIVGSSHQRTRALATLLVGLVGFTLVMWFNVGPVGVISNNFLSNITQKPGLPGMFIAAALGLLSMIAGALQLRNWMNTEQNAETSPLQQHSNEPRLSRGALAGAIWAGLGLPALILAVVLTSSSERSGSAMTSSIDQASERDESAASSAPPVLLQRLGLAILFIAVTLAASSVVGTTILGAVAIGQIKHSRGRLYGLGLAAADVLFFPLLILGIATAVLTHLAQIAIWTQEHTAYVYKAGIVTDVIAPNPADRPDMIFLFLDLLVAFIVCFFVGRSVWRVISPPMLAVESSDRSASPVTNEVL